MSYVLSCCSTADLTKEHFERRGIHYICFHYQLDGKDMLDDLADEGESPARTELRDRCATRLAGLPVGPFLIAASLS